MIDRPDYALVTRVQEGTETQVYWLLVLLLLLLFNNNNILFTF